MGWTNPPVPWRDLERTLSATRRPDAPSRREPEIETLHSRKRGRYTAPPVEPWSGVRMPYAELHAHSSFSFLDGASSPEELVEEAARLGLDALALTDHDGFYGVARFAEAAEQHGLDTVYGAELSLGLSGPQNGVPDPEGHHLLLLARGAEGYHRLAAAITEAQLADGAEKGRPRYDLDALAELRGAVVALTGCRKGLVRQALGERGADTAAAGAALDRLIDVFGIENVVVELIDHGEPLDTRRNDALAALAAERGLRVIASGNVHYARPELHRLASTVAAIRARRSLDELDGWLPATGGAHLRSGAEMAERFARYPGAAAGTVALARELAFPLRLARPGLPKLPVPEGHTPMTWLRALTFERLPTRYPDARPNDPDDPVVRRLEKELAVIEAKDFPGYFLIVEDIVRFARENGILCQGRGSAAASAVCYVLGITAVDAILYDLPFERFLSNLRDEEPDIDVDFDSDRREEAIQHVYRTYGRRNAAQVANVITYRPKFAVRDVAKALGYGPGQQDAWSKQVEAWGRVEVPEDSDVPEQVIATASELLRAPRHLGIHSGGMVLTDRPVGEVVPIEHARMEGRTVLQWDKDDCAYMGLVKFDLLGLGMLGAIQHCLDLVRDTLGERWELASIPAEEQGVYDMLSRGDSIGVFQVESRAQIGTLPRLRPRCFYDLVIEIALIRPGPIQGGAVHPYLRRRLGQEKVTFLHPKLEPVLGKTLGVPIFQEQLMQMAVAIADFSGEDADQLRRAMGSKRGVEKIDSLRDKLYAGMARNGLDRETANAIYDKIKAFADFGFAESHSLSFALLVYASSWLKLHYPAAFLAALLRSQPMGFYSSQSLVADARRHGVRVERPDLLRSHVHAELEPLEAAATGPTGLDSCTDREQPPVGPFDPAAPHRDAEHRRDGRYAVRLGLAGVTGIGTALAERIVAERERHGAYRDLGDLARRVGLTTPQLEALASAGAASCFGLDRRQALWEAGQAAQERPEYLAGTAVSIQPPLLPLLSPSEQTAFDLWATDISPEGHPIEHLRPALRSRGCWRIADLSRAEAGRRLEVGGVVTHRQRPGTAGGVTFFNLEDETGMLNVLCTVGVFARFRRVAREAPALVIRGVLERTPEGVMNLVADRLEALSPGVRHRSRDFR